MLNIGGWAGHPEPVVNPQPSAPLHLVAAYVEGQGDLVSRLIMGILHITIGVINVLTKSPCPPSRRSPVSKLAEALSLILDRSSACCEVGLRELYA